MIMRMLPLTYSARENFVLSRIQDKFYYAGRSMGWKTKTGLGIPIRDLNKVYDCHADLGILVFATSETWWVSYSTLREWARHNKYSARNGPIKIAYIEQDIMSRTKPQTRRTVTVSDFLS